MKKDQTNQVLGSHVVSSTFLILKPNHLSFRNWKMVSHLTLIISLVGLLYLCHFHVEANFRPFQKKSCWMCDAPRCDKCVTSQWTTWNQCSAPCGLNGYQSRNRVVHQPSSCGAGSCQNLIAKEWRPCNRWCQNGGTPARWGCQCPLNYIGDCCETGQLTMKLILVT